MDEDFKDVIENSKKIGIIFVLLIVVLLVGGYFLVFKPIYFSVKTVEIELGEELPTDMKSYLSNYGGNIDDYELDTNKVDITTVGEYKYTISNSKLSKEGKIKVVDTTAPTFTLREMTIEEGNLDYFLGDFLETCEDKSKPCLVTLKNDKDESKFSTPGTYTIEIEVADVYGNKNIGKANLTVVEKGKYTDPRSLDLEYASNSGSEGAFTGTIYKMLDKALNPDSDEASDEMSNISTIDLETYIRTNHDGYRLISSNIIVLYNKSGFVIGYAIEIKISNGKETTIYVDPTKIPTSKPEGTSENDDKKEE